ncbi:RDD family protein [Marinigracilibium pacificum]|uniref:RDD family protein n=1 Tax=Marinigracilibium pacificum TaxID=2729599 RepID=A0A848J873_9BACT|nr:RDD family protein [Marinigracilibium pacificum]NMM50579.1 RDD family protein [Marinigracilibium pacificum]
MDFNEQILDSPTTNIISEEVVKRAKSSHGKRLGGYIIDRVIISLCFYGALFVITLSGSSFFLNLNNVFFFLISLGWTVTYYLLFEGIFGRTPAKMMMNMKVVSEKGGKPDGVEIFARTLFRLVPFEGFSFLGEKGWHDDWSKTTVVDINKL